MQIRGWKAWEAETSSHGYEFANGMMSDDVFNCFTSLSVKITSSLILLISIPIYFEMLLHTISCQYWEFTMPADPSRFRLTHETSFVRAHASFWTRYSIFFYIVSLILLICYVFILYLPEVADLT